MRWAQGAEALFSADFVTADGGAVDLVVNPAVQILDPDSILVTSGTGTPLDGGRYNFAWDVPDDAELGMWRITWDGTSTDGVELFGQEWFEVVEPGTVVFSGGLSTLTNMLDRRFPGMPESSYFFTDEEIHSIYLKNDQNVEQAAIEGWLIKAAVFAELVDQSEGGTDRRLSQKFRNAMAFVKYLTDKADSASLARLKGRRVVGKPINLRGELHDPMGVFAGGWHNGNTPMYVRTYPLKRFPAIL